MPNSSSADWDTTYPSDTASDFADGAAEIRILRAAVALRLNKEHVDAAGSSVGGEHVAGSAFAYYQASAPTTRPDTTALSSADYGRIWVDSDDKQVYVYTASGWVEASKRSVAVGYYTGNGVSGKQVGVATGFAPDFVMIFSLAENVRCPVFSAKTVHAQDNLRPTDGTALITYSLTWLTNGFQLDTTDDRVNKNGDVYIYLALRKDV